jgi:hypothetical protein
MSDNRSIRKKMEKIFGKICMIEETGIRKIPKSKRKKIKGYKSSDDDITYHHIKEKSKGGKATIRNGALLKVYNHKWLHSLPDEEKDQVNEALIEFKASIITIVGNEIQTKKGITICFDKEDLEQEYDSIPVENNTREILSKRKKFNRAKIKNNTTMVIKEGLEDYEGR